MFVLTPSINFSRFFHHCIHGTLSVINETHSLMIGVDCKNTFFSKDYNVLVNQIGWKGSYNNPTEKALMKLLR